jgi:hypothetical protein
MYKQMFYSVVFVAVMASHGLQAQDGNRETAVRPFTFRQGQAVYIVAYHTIEHFTAYGRYPVPPTNVVDAHLPAEQRVRKEFEQRRVYKVVEKASEADFIFLVVIHDSAAEGLALPPEKYAQYPSKIGIEAMREAAYARSAVGPFKIHTLGKISDRLVEEFHKKTIAGSGKAP